jgi:predicted RNase H-like nuclease
VPSVGVDACKQGWIAVLLTEGPAIPFFVRHIRNVGELVPSLDVVAIDIPIGWPVLDQRQADVAARNELHGTRRSTVFPLPTRDVLAATSYSEATRRSVERTGKGISRQTYGLRSKVLEVEAWLPSSPCEVIEVHPELSFAELTHDPKLPSKHTWAGMWSRHRALVNVGVDLDWEGNTAGLACAVDDMLDAGVAAWSARRYSEGAARSIPDPPETDKSGRKMAIWV